MFLQNFRTSDIEKTWSDPFSLSLIHLGEQPNGSDHVLPVIIRSGARSGPVTVLTAGIHGDEPLSSDVITTVLHSIKDEDVTGTVIGLPFVSYVSASTRTRRLASEGYPGPHDLNRVFPGSPNGTISERTAHLVVTQFIERANFLFDIHTPALGGRWHPYASLAEPAPGIGAEVCSASHDLARAFGAPVVIPHANSGTIVEAALLRGVAATVAEFGRAHLRDQESRELGIDGLRNVLRHTGNISGERTAPATTTTVTRLSKIRAERGGFLRLDVVPGQQVEQGQILGSVEALDGSVIEQLTAPNGGLVCRVNELAMVATGEFVAYIGEIGL